MNSPTWIHRNTRAPMPELLISSSSTATTVVSPPALAFQAPMRILKRPSSQNSGSNSTSSQTLPESLAQREARYQAARERIFGGDDGSGSNISDSIGGKSRRGIGSQKGSPSLQATHVIRNPIGPSESSIDMDAVQVSKGFKRRSTKQPAEQTTSPNGSI
jgi:hypothetical protein